MKHFILFLNFLSLFLTSASFADVSDLVATDKLNQKIDLSLTFTNEKGEVHTISDMFEKTPVLIITMNYYRCKTMCTYQFLNLSQAIKELNWNVGKDYTVASISFDPTDTTTIATQIQDIWRPKTNQPDAQWHFWINKEDHAAQLAKSIHFAYEKRDDGMYSHAGGLFFINKDGVFYRYLNGIVYEKNDLKKALIETSNNKLGNILDKMSTYFMKYNAKTGKYE